MIHRPTKIFILTKLSVLVEECVINLTLHKIKPEQECKKQATEEKFKSLRIAKLTTHATAGYVQLYTVH